LDTVLNSSSAIAEMAAKHCNNRIFTVKDLGDENSASFIGSSASLILSCSSHFGGFFYTELWRPFSQGHC